MTRRIPSTPALFASDPARMLRLAVLYHGDRRPPHRRHSPARPPRHSVIARRPRVAFPRTTCPIRPARPARYSRRPLPRISAHPAIRPRCVMSPPARRTRCTPEYGITSHEPGQYEVDHLVALELGGSNSIANLWPEPAEPRPGFHEKDKVEDYLHAQLCDGKLSLQQVQVQIATNWVEVFNKLP